MKRWKNQTWYWFSAFILAFALVLFLKAFVFFPVPVAGDSMSPAINSEDHIILENFSSIKRFEIIVFKAKSGETFVKRVIGLPGETISYHSGKLYVDGKVTNEPFLNKKSKKNFSTSDFTLTELTGQKKIPKNSYFVLGDNRRISIDSRTLGTIKQNEIIGQALFIYYPFNHVKVL